MRHYPSFLPFLFIGVGVIAFMLGTYYLLRYLRCRKYPSIEATVLKSEVYWNGTQEGVVHSAYVEFTYSISGKQFISNRFCSLGALSKGGAKSQEQLENVVAEYPVGRRIHVFYNPDHPEFSFIRNGPVFQLAALYSFSLLFPLVGMLLNR